MFVLTYFRYSSIFQRERGGFQATTREGLPHDIVYYLGIIDIFTTYNIVKQLEYTYKSTIYETKVLFTLSNFLLTIFQDSMSAVDSVKYADRFKKFIAKNAGWKEAVVQ